MVRYEIEEEAHDIRCDLIGNYDARRLDIADGLINEVLRIKPGPYVHDPDCILLVQIILRAVAVRRFWYSNQKRLYLSNLMRKTKAWAPRLYRQRGGLRGVIERAIALGMPIKWSDEDEDDLLERVNVLGLIKPVLKRIHPQLRAWGRGR